MLGSGVISQRQHVGLQKLCELAQVSHSFLGPNQNYKFIQDDATGESVLAGSCLRIFENLQLSCAVGQLVHATLQGHHRVCHTGSGCLLFLAGSWSRAALEGLRRGLSPGSVVSALSEGLDVCLEICKKSSIPVETLPAPQSENLVAPSDGSGAIVEACGNAPQQPRGAGLKALKLSRHFCGSKSERPSALEPPVLQVAEALSHGRVRAMDLVTRAYRTQAEDGQDPLAFDLSKVATCVLPALPEDHACVLRGCVLLLPAEQASLARRLQEQRLKVALINGDLADTYRHLGFNRQAGLRRVSDRLGSASSNKEEEWLEKVEALLSRLEVNLILVSGRVSENVLLRFCRRRILAVEKVRVSLLKAFADATGAVPVTYATQLSRACVGVGASVTAWREVLRPDGSPWTAVNVRAGGSAGLVTAVLTGCVWAKLQALEDHFWACAYRLHHALRDGRLLLGAGVTEMLCAQGLQKHADGLAAAADPYRGAVLRLMAEGLTDYVSTLMVNAGRFSKVGARSELDRLLKDCREGWDMCAAMSELLSDSEEGRGPRSEDAPSHVYDCSSVKQEAWRRALDLVLLVLQADAEVITGISKEAGGSQDALVLL